MVTSEELYNYAMNKLKLSSESAINRSTVYFTDDRALYFVGALHVHGNDPFIDFLKNIFDKINPDFLLVERPKNYSEKEIAYYLSLPESSRRESEWAISFARERKIGFSGLDPTYEESFKTVWDKYGINAAILIFFLQYYSAGKNGGKTTEEAYVAAKEAIILLVAGNQNPFLYGKEIAKSIGSYVNKEEGSIDALEGLERLLQYATNEYIKNGNLKDLLEKKNKLLEPYPWVEKGYKITEISTFLVSIRNKVFIDLCIAAMKEHGKVLALAGAGHIPEITEFLKKEIEATFGSCSVTPLINKDHTINVPLTNKNKTYDKKTRHIILIHDVHDKSIDNLDSQIRAVAEGQRRIILMEFPRDYQPMLDTLIKTCDSSVSEKSESLNKFLSDKTNAEFQSAYAQKFTVFLRLYYSGFVEKIEFFDQAHTKELPASVFIKEFNRLCSTASDLHAGTSPEVRSKIWLTIKFLRTVSSSAFDSRREVEMWKYLSQIIKDYNTLIILCGAGHINSFAINLRTLNDYKEGKIKISDIGTPAAINRARIEVPIRAKSLILLKQFNPSVFGDIMAMNTNKSYKDTYQQLYETIFNKISEDSSLTYLAFMAYLYQYLLHYTKPKRTGDCIGAIEYWIRTFARTLELTLDDPPPAKEIMTLMKMILEYKAFTSLNDILKSINEVILRQYSKNHDNTNGIGIYGV